MLIARAPTQSIPVPGPRSHHVGAYCARLCASALGLDLFDMELEDPQRLKRLLPADAPPLTVERTQDFYRAMADYLLFSTGHLRHPATGQYLNKDEVILNTALVGASDPVRLLVRLNGGWGRNLYVEGPNRDWLAAIVEEGLDSGVLRRFRGPGDADSGWSGLAAFLRLRDDEPAVLSRDENDEAFPSAPFGAPFVPPQIALATTVGWAPTQGVRPDWGGDEEDRWLQWKAAAWDRLPLADQWTYALQGLRQFEAHDLELRPGNWRSYTFGDGYNAFQLLAATYEGTVPQQ